MGENFAPFAASLRPLRPNYSARKVREEDAKENRDYVVKRGALGNKR